MDHGVASVWIWNHLQCCEEEHIKQTVFRLFRFSEWIYLNYVSMFEILINDPLKIAV